MVIKENPPADTDALPATTLATQADKDNVNYSHGLGRTNHPLLNGRLSVSEPDSRFQSSDSGLRSAVNKSNRPDVRPQKPVAQAPGEGLTVPAG